MLTPREAGLALLRRFSVCCVCLRYPADLKTFTRSGIKGGFDRERAGQRMKLKQPETWERLLSQEGNTAATWQKLIGLTSRNSDPMTLWSSLSCVRSVSLWVWKSYMVTFDCASSQIVWIISRRALERDGGGLPLHVLCYEHDALTSILFFLQTISLFRSWPCWGTWGTWSLRASARLITRRSSAGWPIRWEAPSVFEAHIYCSSTFILCFKHSHYKQCYHFKLWGVVLF